MDHNRLKKRMYVETRVVVLEELPHIINVTAGRIDNQHGGACIKLIYHLYNAMAKVPFTLIAISEKTIDSKVESDNASFAAARKEALELLVPRTLEHILWLESQAIRQTLRQDDLDSFRGSWNRALDAAERLYPVPSLMIMKEQQMPLQVSLDTPSLAKLASWVKNSRAHMRVVDGAESLNSSVAHPNHQIVHLTPQKQALGPDHQVKFQAMALLPNNKSKAADTDAISDKNFRALSTICDEFITCERGRMPKSKKSRARSVLHVKIDNLLWFHVDKDGVLSHDARRLIKHPHLDLITKVLVAWINGSQNPLEKSLEKIKHERMKRIDLKDIKIGITRLGSLLRAEFIDDTLMAFPRDEGQQNDIFNIPSESGQESVIALTKCVERQGDAIVIPSGPEIEAISASPSKPHIKANDNSVSLQQKPIIDESGKLYGTIAQPEIISQLQLSTAKTKLEAEAESLQESQGSTDTVSRISPNDQNASASELFPVDIPVSVFLIAKRKQELSDTSGRTNKEPVKRIRRSASFTNHTGLVIFYEDRKESLQLQLKENDFIEISGALLKALPESFPTLNDILVAKRESSHSRPIPRKGCSVRYFCICLTKMICENVNSNDPVSEELYRVLVNRGHDSVLWQALKFWLQHGWKEELNPAPEDIVYKKHIYKCVFLLGQFLGVPKIRIDELKKAWTATRSANVFYGEGSVLSLLEEDYHKIEFYR